MGGLLNNLTKQKTQEIKSKKTKLSDEILQIIGLLKQRLEGEGREGPAAELGELGEGLDPGQPQRVKLLPLAPVCPSCLPGI